MPTSNCIEVLAISTVSGKFFGFTLYLAKKRMNGESLPVKYPAQKFPPATMQKSFD